MKRYTCGILYRKNEILIGRRSIDRDNYPGVWDFIGGNCEMGESFEDGLTRELMEEIGIIPINYDLIFEIDQAPEFTLSIYLISSWKGSPINKDLNEHEQIKWCSFIEAKEFKYPDPRYYEILDFVEDKIKKTN